MKKIKLKLSFEELICLNNFCESEANKTTNKLECVILLELFLCFQSKLFVRFDKQKSINLKIYQAITIENSIRKNIDNYNNSPFDYAVLVSILLNLSTKL